MKHLIIPLLLIAIGADWYCWWKYDEISNHLFYVGETCVYLTWVLAFWIYVKWGVNEFQKKIITLILLFWIPCCANAIYRQFTEVGHGKSLVDFYSASASALFIIGQVVWWWYKNKKNRSG